ncbi:MAG: hypothetical protein ACRCSP_06075 [Rhodoglobus sp.]
MQIGIRRSYRRSRSALGVHTLKGVDVFLGFVAETLHGGNAEMIFLGGNAEWISTIVARDTTVALGHNRYRDAATVVAQTSGVASEDAPQPFATIAHWATVGL